MQTLLRFAPTLLLLLAAALVWSRASGPDVFVLIGMEHLVGPDPRAQASASWKVLGALGLLSFGVACVRQVTAKPHEPED